MRLIAAIKKFYEEFKEPRYRDRRAFYASELTANSRDLFWSLTGVRETNRGDITGRMRMDFGKWIEEGITKKVLANLHWFGIHAYTSQIPVGSSDPIAVDGYLDSLLVQRDGDKMGQPYVLEIKTKWGFGADLFLRNIEVPTENLAQMGLYLKDLSEKGVTSKGILLYVLFSDANLMDMVQVDCSYDGATNTVSAESYIRLGKGGELASGPVGATLELGPLFEKLQKIKECVKTGTLPASEHQYKKPLTPEFIDSLSDYKLKAMINGEKIEGDWQIRYSRYFDLHLQHEGSSREYTPDEIALLSEAYQRRHPKSKVGKKAS